MNETIKQKLQRQIFALAARHPFKFAGGLAAAGFLIGALL